MADLILLIQECVIFILYEECSAWSQVAEFSKNQMSYQLNWSKTKLLHNFVNTK